MSIYAHLSKESYLGPKDYRRYIWWLTSKNKYCYQPPNCN
ncbi:hypothetical protein I3760_16G079800 [Carya illinoinensis]|nr:hypothetical protein I3760_16G079800 [Carya illinoinensis]